MHLQLRQSCPQRRTLNRTQVTYGVTENAPVSTLPAQIYQLQVLASELKSGFTEAMQELSRIQHGEYGLEEKVKSCRCPMEEKVTEMKNSLNNLKEEVNTAMAMIHAIIAKQEEMQQKIEQLQQEKRRESRKVKNKTIQKEEHMSQTHIPQNSSIQPSNHPEPMLINHHYNDLMHSSLYEKVPVSRSGNASESNLMGATTSTPRPSHEETEDSYSSSNIVEAQSRVYMPSLIWRQPKEGREWDEEHSPKEQGECPREMTQNRNAPMDNVLSEPAVFARRQNGAKDLLESERKYVLNLSHILKIRSTLQGSEIKKTIKQRSFFPSSLRYLIQHHLDLLHILQDRVLKWSRQGILGDIFLKLTNDENNFLDYYVAYLKDLPESISVIHIVVLKEAEEDIKSDLYILLFHVVQRIPEYLILLQNILKYTEQDHPDYYLLLVCVQRLRVFISHYSVLFQYNEDLLIQKRKKLKKSSLIKLYKGLASQCSGSSQEILPSLSNVSKVKENTSPPDETVQPYQTAPGSSSSITHMVPHIKKSRQTPVENIQSLKSSEWDIDGKKHDRSENMLAHTLFPGSDQEVNSLMTPLQSIPEMEYESTSMDAMLNMERSMRTSSNILPDGNFAPSYEEYEYGGSIIGVSAPYEEETFPNRPLFESCSAGSSESSLDICFLKPINFTLESNRTERAMQPLARNCLSPVSNSSYRHEGIHVKNKPLSRSLKEFPRNQETVSTTRMYSTRSTNPSRMQFRQERDSQSHGLSTTTRNSQRHFYIPQRPHCESRSLLEDIHMDGNARFYQKDETEQTSFSEHHSRSDQKGGFRSSFRKLFKKKSCGVENKEKTSEKSSIDQSPTRQDIFRAHSALINELDRGTAV
ncbi:rho guanine nucleotide exchange factor 33 [Spea bombifrons]|uniref:rho guanine nucleotide exchange factor 33 n=1 Tax=Spea bombifrons TaxID=233779 RepID=UPI00234BCD2B|nr:rho guanine nucleotide exchange factor 33 [Spea bombifrons]